jgi:hypothetical protein
MISQFQGRAGASTTALLLWQQNFRLCTTEIWI